MSDTSGPAFPSASTATNYASTGMTKRDYFAAAALPWVLADIKLDMGMLSKNFMEAAAEWSYEMADAMIKARNGHK